MRRKILIFISLVLAFASLSIIVPSDSASADSEAKITICHRHNSVTNPYNTESVKYDAVDGEGDNDHTSHTGLLAYSEEVATLLKDPLSGESDPAKWGDIIPSFNYSYTDNQGRLHTYSYGGMNWTEQGQAMYNNDCNYVTGVTPVAVIFVNATCDLSGSYTIPSTTGVGYYIGTTLIPAGTYSVTADATVTVTAQALTGYTITTSATKQWTNSFHIPVGDECVQGAQSVTPSPVTFVDATCESSGSFTVPTTVGVTYYMGDDEVVAAGTYPVVDDTSITVYAIANEGYIFNDGVTTQWTHEFSIPTEEECSFDEVVIPDEVTFVDASCDDYQGSYTVPETAGVKYYIDEVVVPAGTYPVSENGTITIEAVADEGYALDETATSYWSHLFDIPTREECVLGSQSVIPAPVIFAAPTCSAKGYYTVASTTGIKYYVDNQVVTSGKHEVVNGLTVTVTAVADEGYDIKPGSVNQWSYTFTAPTDCDGSGSVLGASTAAPSTLPVTSGSSVAAGLALVSIIAAVGTIFGAVLRFAFVRLF